MKILVLASIIPIPGLKRENDIILKTYKEIKNRFKVEFYFSKSVNYSNGFLALFHRKFKVFNALNGQLNYKEPKYNTSVLFYRWISFKNSIRLKSLLGPINYFLFSKKIEKLSENFKPDMIHANNLYSDGYVALRLYEKYKIPYVLTLRMPPSYKMSSDNRTSKILSSASKIICHNYEIENKFKSTFNLCRTAHGIDEKFYNSKARTLDYDSEPLRIITVARFLDWKNIDLMIKSLNRFAQRGIEFEYSIVGEGPELENLKKLVDNLEMSENITFIPWVDQKEIINLFQQNHLFALMSYPETLGRIFFEAIANSLPILCTEKSGAYGLISSTHGASYARLDEEEIESSLHDIYVNYPSIAQAAVIGSHFVEKYNWDSMSDFYFKLFQDSKN